MAQLHIVCHRPGMIRGGVRHPPHAAYPLDAFAPEALAELLADPQLVVVVGELATPELVESTIANEAATKAALAEVASAAVAMLDVEAAAAADGAAVKKKARG